MGWIAFQFDEGIAEPLAQTGAGVRIVGASEFQERLRY